MIEWVEKKKYINISRSPSIAWMEQIDSSMPRIGMCMKITVNFQSVPLIIVRKLSLSELLPAVLCTTVITYMHIHTDSSYRWIGLR